MNTNKYISMLSTNCNLIIVKDDKIVFTSDERGIKTLLKLHQENFLLDVDIYDSVVGRAALALAIDGSCHMIYAKTISKVALTLDAKNTIVKYDTLVPYIINRAGDGRCPMESKVEFAVNAKEAVSLLKK